LPRTFQSVFDFAWLKCVWFRGKKCPGFGNFVSEFSIDGKRFAVMLLARFVEHFAFLKD
jgi:hypothetical protein